MNKFVTQIRFHGNVDTCKSHLKMANKQMDRLISNINKPLKQRRSVIIHNDGVVVECLIVFKLAIINIYSDVPRKELPPKEIPFTEYLFFVFGMWDMNGVPDPVTGEVPARFMEFCTLIDASTGIEVDPTGIDPYQLTLPLEPRPYNPAETVPPGAGYRVEFPGRYTQNAFDFVNNFFNIFVNPDPPIWGYGHILRLHDIVNDVRAPRYNINYYYDECENVNSNDFVTFSVIAYGTPPGVGIYDHINIDGDVPYSCSMPPYSCCIGPPWDCANMAVSGIPSSGYGKDVYYPTKYSDWIDEFLPSYDNIEGVLVCCSSYLYREHTLPPDGYPPDTYAEFKQVRTGVFTSTGVTNDNVGSIKEVFIPWWGQIGTVLDSGTGGYNTEHLPIIKRVSIPSIDEFPNIAVYDGPIVSTTFDKVDPKNGTVFKVTQAYYTIGDYNVYFMFLLKRYASLVALPALVEPQYEFSCFTWKLEEYDIKAETKPIEFFNNIDLNTIFADRSREPVSRGIEQGILRLTQFMVDNGCIFDRNPPVYPDALNGYIQYLDRYNFTTYLLKLK